jgi:hypothetical protein
MSSTEEKLQQLALNAIEFGKAMKLPASAEVYAIAGVEAPAEAARPAPKTNLAAKMRAAATKYFIETYAADYATYRSGLSEEEKLPKNTMTVQNTFGASKRYKNGTDNSDGDSVEYTDFCSGFTDGASSTDSAAKRAGATAKTSAEAAVAAKAAEPAKKPRAKKTTATEAPAPVVVVAEVSESEPEAPKKKGPRSKSATPATSPAASTVAPPPPVIKEAEPEVKVATVGVRKVRGKATASNSAAASKE